MSEDHVPLPDNELSPWKLHLRKMKTEKAQRLKNKKKRFHHKGPKKKLGANPYEPRTWSHTFWQEGFDSDSDECPYHDTEFEQGNEFAAEVWWDGREAKLKLQAEDPWKKYSEATSETIAVGSIFTREALIAGLEVLRRGSC